MFAWLRRLFGAKKPETKKPNSWLNIGVVADEIRSILVRDADGKVIASSKGATVGADGTWIAMTAIASGEMHDVAYCDDSGRAVLVSPWRAMSVWWNTYACVGDIVRIANITIDVPGQREIVTFNCLRLTGVVVEQPVKPKRKRTRRKKAKAKPKRTAKAKAKPKTVRR